MSATKRNVNFVNVQFTPSGEPAITLNGVVDVKRSGGGKLIKFKGDNDQYPSTVAPDGGDPTITVTTADLVDLQSLPIGTAGSFTYTHRDAKNGTGAGAITYTAAVAMVEDVDDGGQHAQFGMGQLKIACVSPDGQTNPVVATVATGS